MLTSGALNNVQATTANFAQIQYFQANLNYAQTSQTQVTSANGQQTASYSSAITISLSITAINITSGFLAAEKVVDSTAPSNTNSSDNQSRAKGIEDALKEFLKTFEENNSLNGRIAKKLSQLVSALNTARGTDRKPGDFSQDDRNDVRSARRQVNDFFQEKHSTVFIDEDLANFIKLISKIETLREFSLKTTDLLTALKAGEEEGDDDSDNETDDDKHTPVVNTTV